MEEYENGGDMREALKREMLEHQIDFERDPAMRDLASPSHPASDTPAEVADDQLIDRLLENSGSGDQPSEENLSEEQSPYRQDDRPFMADYPQSLQGGTGRLVHSRHKRTLLLVVFVYLSRH